MDFELRAAETAIILIDFQKGIVSLPTAPHSAESVAENAVRLLEAARSAGARVILVPGTASPDGGDALRPEADQAVSSGFPAWFSFAETRLWAGIFLMPMMLGFLDMGPVSGALSDRFGAGEFATGGMLLSLASFLLPAGIPSDFAHGPFLAILVLLGFGQGMFASPNTASIVNVVPAEPRGTAFGMRATLQNSGMLLSLALFFSVVISKLAVTLPAALVAALRPSGLPASAVGRVTSVPPTSALLAALLGYTPMASMLPPAVLRHLSPALRSQLLGKAFFPQAIAPAFISGPRPALYLSAVLSLMAAIASALRGERFIRALHHRDP